MTTSRRYTLITPRIDRSGHCNVAVDIPRATAASGQVSLLCLPGIPARHDLSSFADVRRWGHRDLWSRDGVVHTHCLSPDLIGWLHGWNPQCTVLTTLRNLFLFNLGFDHCRWKVRFAWVFWSRALSRFDHRVCISAAMPHTYSKPLLTESDALLRQPNHHRRCPVVRRLGQRSMWSVARKYACYKSRPLIDCVISRVAA